VYLLEGAPPAVEDELLADHASATLELVTTVPADLTPRASWLGDLDGDGLQDIGVAVQNLAPNGSDSGQAFVLMARPSGLLALSTAADVTLDGATPGEGLGTVLVGLDDVNGDGTADVALGVSEWGLTGGASALGPGRVYLLSGADLVAEASATTPTTDPAAFAFAEIVGVDTGDNASGWLASAGDPDGDGWTDLLVAASQVGWAPSRAGAAYLVTPPSSGTLDLSVDATATFPGVPGSSLGAWFALAGDGDLDGDGVDDLVLGDPRNDAVTTDAGAAWVFFGGW
jgi:hypothetical protein